MAEISTLARPYAQAAFELAKSHKALAKWSEMLARLSAIVQDERVQQLIGNPKVTKDLIVGFVLDVAGKNLNAQAQNFVKLLVENGRLRLLPEIAALFDALKAEEESTLQAEVVSAFELSGDQKSKIADALKKRLKRDVTVVTTVDANLLGGAIIRAGDLVIDGSASGQLQRLASTLNG